jgi:phosphate transport system substrate-binding protein
MVISARSPSYYNVTVVDNLQLDAPTLAKIFSWQESTKWTTRPITRPEQRLAKPAVHRRSATVHRSTESGTTDNFTKYLSKTAESAWTFGNAKAWKAPGGVGAAKSTAWRPRSRAPAGTISYVELSFAENSDLKKPRSRTARASSPSSPGRAPGKTIAGAKVAGTGQRPEARHRLRHHRAGAYPIVLVTYEIACSKGSPKAAAIKGFLSYTASTGGQSALAELGYAPLPEAVRSKVETSVAAIS